MNLLTKMKKSPARKEYWNHQVVNGATVGGIYKRYILACIIIMLIGIFTATYQTNISNAELVGGGLIVAGVIGLLHCAHIIKNVHIANYTMELAIGYRIGTFIVASFMGPYENPEMVDILVWLLLLFSAIENRKYMIAAQKIRYQRRKK